MFALLNEKFKSSNASGSFLYSSYTDKKNPLLHHLRDLLLVSYKYNIFLGLIRTDLYLYTKYNISLYYLNRSFLTLSVKSSKYISMSSLALAPPTEFISYSLKNISFSHSLVHSFSR